MAVGNCRSGQHFLYSGDKSDVMVLLLGCTVAKPSSEPMLQYY